MAGLPGPADVFRERIPDLSENIGNSSNFDRAANRFLAEGLISQAFLSDTTTTSSYSDYRRGSAVARELHRQLQSSSDPKALLVKICDTLTKEENPTLQQLGKDMKISVDRTTSKGRLAPHTASLTVRADKGAGLDIRDLDAVNEKLSSFPFPCFKWKQLGISLGLYKPTLDDIDDTCRGKSSQCLIECLGAWLEGNDNVNGKGGSSWSSLKHALEKIGEKACAEKIDLTK